MLLVNNKHGAPLKNDKLSLLIKKKNKHGAPTWSSLLPGYAYVLQLNSHNIKNLLLTD